MGGCLFPSFSDIYFRVSSKQHPVSEKKNGKIREGIIDKIVMKPQVITLTNPGLGDYSTVSRHS